MKMSPTQYWSYEWLKSEVAKKSFSRAKLESYKDLFKDEIQSTRRYACIENVGDLLDCLQRRDALSEWNIEPLLTIAEDIDDDEIALASMKYVAPPEPSELQNVFELHRLQERISIKAEIKSEYPKAEQKPIIVIEFTQKKRDDVYSVIAKEIGRDWRSLGRGLQVRAGDLDKIDAKHPHDLHSKVYEVLEVFENDPRHNPREHYDAICEALDGCMRKDIRRNIQKMMTY